MLQELAMEKPIRVVKKIPSPTELVFLPHATVASLRRVGSEGEAEGSLKQRGRDGGREGALGRDHRRTRVALLSSTFSFVS